MDIDRYFLEIALEEAEIAFREGSVPIGAVLVDPDGNILSKGRNRIFTNNDPTCHAEIDVIRQAGEKLLDPTYKNKCTLYSTVEPCPMCSGALILADISKAVWALSDDYLGAMRIMKKGNHFRHKFDKISVISMPYKDLAIRSQELHRQWDERRGIKYIVSDIV
ncbi:tRNA-specific adenosine deaminase [Paenibacillus marchantiophytorum]|uniref:tRNA-specific adenosine deaminase n=1 Tax=Paenibacillus marchantiophytorum TaxID=1619310 RepID=A0ABQ1EMC4_9BACL|nr:nucleoside deaminase [Paenibacillus marchantiophytorum]GFZ77823.1 tRNA-specific adenosine deaminase [Paenibacillus marchantiophytorum]